MSFSGKYIVVKMCGYYWENDVGESLKLFKRSLTLICSDCLKLPSHVAETSRPLSFFFFFFCVVLKKCLAILNEMVVQQA